MRVVLSVVVVVEEAEVVFVVEVELVVIWRTDVVFVVLDDVDVVEWVKTRLFYGGCEDDMRFSDELISFRNQIRKSLDVEPLSVENLGKFLVSCLGRRILI